MINRTKVKESTQIKPGDNGDVLVMKDNAPEWSTPSDAGLAEQANVDSELSKKQDKLVAGDNIYIDGNTISAASEPTPISIGTVTEGDTAMVSNSGTDTNVVLNFVMPKGVKGDQGPQGNPGAAATVTVGTTTTGEAGTEASVTNSGTTSAAVLNFVIPKGDKGDKGEKGDPGQAGESGTQVTSIAPLTVPLPPSAIGSQSISFGNSATSQSNYSMSIGYIAQVRGNSQGAIALGAQSLAEGNDAIAIGRGSKAESIGEISIGGNANGGNQSITIGDSAEAGELSVTIGYQAKNDYHSVAIGALSKTTSRGSVAMGASTTVSSDSSVAIGYNSSATEDNTVSVGSGGSDDQYATRRIVNVTDPRDAQDAATKNYVDTQLTPINAKLQYVPENTNQILSQIQTNVEKAQSAADAKVASITAGTGISVDASNPTAPIVSTAGLATQASVDTLTTTVNSKADQTTVDSLTATVNGKVSSITAGEGISITGTATEPVISATGGTVDTGWMEITGSSGSGLKYLTGPWTIPTGAKVKIRKFGKRVTVVGIVQATEDISSGASTPLLSIPESDTYFDAFNLPQVSQYDIAHDQQKSAATSVLLIRGMLTSFNVEQNLDTPKIDITLVPVVGVAGQTANIENGDTVNFQISWDTEA